MYRHSVLSSFLIIFLLFSPVGSADDSELASRDNGSVALDRDEAIREAIVSVDSSASGWGVVEVTEGELRGEDGVQTEVERRRHDRKKQFKHLTWSHIRSVINADSILSKEEFLKTREQNLASVLSRAVEVYLPAQIEQERVRLAKFKIAKAIRDLFPEASLDANIRSGSLSGDSFVSDTWRMQFRQPVFRGGVLWNSMLLEFSNLEIAKRSYDKAIADLLGDVAETYFEYERAQNVLRDQMELFEGVSEQKRISDEKAKAELISEIEQLNTDSLYSQAQYDLENAEQELEIALLDLRKFLKLDDGDAMEVVSLYDVNDFNLDSLQRAGGGLASTDADVSESELGELIDLAYQNRPDLQVEASKLKAGQLAYRVALGRRLPQFDVLLEFGELAEAFIVDLPTNARPNHRHEFRIGMEMTLPFAGNTLKYTYDHDQRAPSVTQFLSGAGTRTRANEFSVGLLDDLGQFSSMAEAKVSNLEQVVELEKTEREVVREVKEAYYNFNKSLIQVESAFKRMGYRERLSTLAKHRLDLNEVQISEYLQAEMDLVEERSLFYKAIADFFLSKSQLNRAIGIRDYLTVDVLA